MEEDGEEEEEEMRGEERGEERREERKIGIGIGGERRRGIYQNKSLK
jgi:hypothetical protein